MSAAATLFAVAATDSSNAVLLVTDATVASAGIPGPNTASPTAMPVVLLTVTVALAAVVVAPLNEKVLPVE